MVGTAEQPGSITSDPTTVMQTVLAETAASSATWPDLAYFVTILAVQDDGMGGAEPVTGIDGPYRCNVLGASSFQERVSALSVDDLEKFDAEFEVGSPVAPSSQVQINGWTYEVTGSDIGRSAPTKIRAVLTRTGRQLS